MRLVESWQRRGVVLGSMLLVTVLVWVPLLVGARQGNEGLLTVTFLDVGQGDAVFIETPDHVQVLIDGGANGAVLRELGKVMAVGDRSIDVLLATHPDKDHVGGLVDVLERFSVGTIIRTENRNDTTVSNAFDTAESVEGARVVYARAGQEWQLGASTTFTIISPAADPSDWESNTASIVGVLRYGEIEFLLTGDAPESIERTLVTQYGTRIQSEVVKLGHHGSRTSSSQTFLATVLPAYAVVSSGKDNSYGHPHPEVVERVGEVGATLVNTAELGALVFLSDGDRVWLQK